MKVVKKASYFFFALVLTACGGGSGSGSSFSGLGATSTGTAKEGVASETTDATAATAVKAAATAQKLDASWIKVADEDQTISLPAGTVVQYGANDSYVQKTVSGSMSCTNGFFGSDPLLGVAKACYTQSTTPTGGTTTPTDTRIAGEDQSFTVASGTVVKYGADSRWVQKTVSGAGTCSNAFFGSDPALGTAKACYTTTGSTTTPPTGTAPASGTRLAGENQSFSVASATLVQYGAGSSWVQKTVTGTATCSNTYFGSDPAAGTVKACYSLGAGTGTPTTPTAPTTPTGTAPASGTRLAGENQSFTVAAATLVQYGAGSSWLQRNVTGSATCSNADFGGDPAVGTVKACYSLGAATGTTPPPVVTDPTTPSTPVTPTDPAVVGDILNGSGTVDATAYRATASVMGKDGGIAYRFGPSPAEYGTSSNSGLPTYFKRNDNPFISDQHGGIRPCNPESCGTWQVGNYSNEVGGYSSNIGHVAFIPDSPTQRIGVSNMAISSMSNSVFSQKPELSWTYYGEGLDELNARVYKAAGADASNPVAVGRCYGRPGWCMNSIMVFQGGLIGAAQSNTARNKASTQLAAGKVPTAIAVSNSNEFAFITVWDTVNLRGEIAVVALTGLCDTCTTNNPGGFYDYWGEWNGVYPGLPNLGNFAGMKVLGYVPLPADMKAPTEISVTTGLDNIAYLAAGTPGYDTPWGLSPLSDANKRNHFKPGGRAHGRYAKAGVAVVVSKSEQKVAFVDLKPLFQYYQSMYFGSDADFSATTNLGPGDSQWPRTFAAASQQMPTVIKTMSLPSRPTAVKAYTWGANKRAWVATQDGKLRIFNLGDYPTAGAGSAASITEGASVSVGRNPTGITFAKEKAGGRIYPDITNEVIVTSRGDRQVSWVRFAGDGNSGSIVRTLKDSRLADPISAEDADNHSTESYVLSIADYGGRALRNYRYGPVIMHNFGGQTYGVGASGTDAFEYGGAFDLPGKAFHITSANVP